jgi:lauroyl/myristoyl acyltransferase
VGAALAARAVDRLEHIRRLVPPGYAPTLVERKVGRLWADARYREAQEAQMRYLLEFTDRAAEVPELARKFAEHTLLRTYRRWHPEGLLHQEVRGVEWLTTRRDPDRAVILNFMHHNWYEGLFASLANAGAPITIFASPKVLGPETPTGMRQHIKVVRHGSIMIPATGGTDHIQAQVRPGGTYAIASDVPGHTEAVFLGRRVLSSFGCALIATRTNSQVVLVTNHRTDDGSDGYIRVHEPLEPKEYAEPIDLLQEILRRHGEAVLAWPEVLEMPRARWGILEE